jgi:hypothetical protein
MLKPNEFLTDSLKLISLTILMQKQVVFAQPSILMKILIFYQVIELS